MTETGNEKHGERAIACWKSPSNIALIKYWGKRGNQLPRNASLSITLSNAYTVTRVEAAPLAQAGTGPEVEFRFEGEPNPAFAARIEKYLKQLTAYFDFLPDVKLLIETGNSFPHSAGIASSASGMSALALCLCSIEAQLKGQQEDDTFFRKASLISRLGSGSACRSVFGGITVWGSHPAIAGSSDEYAVQLDFELHPVFRGLMDAILIVHPGEKGVSSSKGHQLMEGHPYAEARFAHAAKNLSELAGVLKSGDWDTFAGIVENEALSLHAMMLTSSPWFMLMHPNSLMIINEIEKFRKQTGTKVCFTLDAGPNIHLLYPEDEAERVASLKETLRPHCHNGVIIEDFMGNGPEKLSCR